MLNKVRRFVNTRNLKSICYANTVLGQNKKSLNMLFLLQKNALRIISFESRSAHSNPFFYKPEIIKLHDETVIENCLFINKSIDMVFHQFLIIYFSFPQALIGTKHLALQKGS